MTYTIIIGLLIAINLFLFNWKFALMLYALSTFMLLCLIGKEVRK